MHRYPALRHLNQYGFDHAIVAVLTVMVCAIAGTYLVVASHAQSVQWKGVLEMSSSNSGSCLSASGSTTNSKVVLDPCSKTTDSNQVWSLNNIKTATVLSVPNVQEFELQSNVGISECLSNPNGSMTNGTAVQLSPCSTTSSDGIWVWGTKFTGKSLSTHQVINVASIIGTRALCLDDSYGRMAAGTKVQMYTCKMSNQANQNWVEASAPSGTSGSGGTAISYTVSGNKIINQAGQQVLLHGVDRPSMEWSCNGQTVTGGPGPIPASDFTTMRNDWNANAVRVPLDQDFWLSGAAKYCSTYESNVATLVKNAQATGLIVILDLHWSDEGNLANASPGQQCMADQNSVTFWQQVANIYKSNPRVWFELYNEPHDISWSDWLNGGEDCGYQTVGMQQLYNAVRGAGAKNIIIAGGNQWASSLNGMPMLNGSNVAYAIHIYRQTASWSTAGWDSQFNNVENKVPVISTEFGDQVCDGQGFDQALLNYFRAHKVGYTAWAWYVSQCDFTSIISSAAGACTNTETGCAIQKDMESYGASPN